MMFGLSLSLFSILAFTVSFSKAEYSFIVRFYEFRNPLGLQCGECESGGQPACCDDVNRRENCINEDRSVGPRRCDIRFRFLLRPFGVETAPTGNFPHFNPTNGGNNATFNEGLGGFLGLPNPFTITSTREWTGKVQFFIDAVDRVVATSGVIEIEAIINHFPIDLKLELGAAFTERTTYTGIYNISGLGFDMSFRVQCSENYYGPNCATFCEGVEGLYTCDRKGRIVCLQHIGRDSATNCTTCRPEWDPETNCTTCLSSVYNIQANCTQCIAHRDIDTKCTTCLRGYDPSTNCTECLTGRDINTACEKCMWPGYNSSTDCTQCLTGRDIETNCTICLPGYDLSTNCTQCLTGLDASTHCTTCLPGRDVRTNCTTCLSGYDPLTNCTQCITGQDIDTNCTTCLPDYDPSTNCTECLTGRDIYTACEKCLLPGYDPSTNCGQCLNGRDIETNCTTCLPGYDPSTNCTQCLTGRDTSTDCMTCLPGLDLLNNCTECLTGFIQMGSSCSRRVVESTKEVTPTETVDLIDGGINPALVGGVTGGVLAALVVIIILILCILIVVIQKRKKTKYDVSDADSYLSVEDSSTYTKKTASGCSNTLQHDLQNPIYGPAGTPPAEQYPLKQLLEVPNPFYWQITDSSSQGGDSKRGSQSSLNEESDAPRSRLATFPYVMDGAENARSNASSTTPHQHQQQRERVEPVVYERADNIARGKPTKIANNMTLYDIADNMCGKPVNAGAGSGMYDTVDNVCGKPAKAGAGAGGGMYDTVDNECGKPVGAEEGNKETAGVVPQWEEYYGDIKMGTGGATADDIIMKSIGAKVSGGAASAAVYDDDLMSNFSGFTVPAAAGNDEYDDIIKGSVKSSSRAAAKPNTNDVFGEGEQLFDNEVYSASWGKPSQVSKRFHLAT